MRRNWVTRATAGSKTIRTRIVAATAFSVSERAEDSVITRSRTMPPSAGSAKSL